MNDDLGGGNELSCVKGGLRRTAEEGGEGIKWFQVSSSFPRLPPSYPIRPFVCSFISCVPRARISTCARKLSRSRGWNIDATQGYYLSPLRDGEMYVSRTRLEERWTGNPLAVWQVGPPACRSDRWTERRDRTGGRCRALGRGIRWFVGGRIRNRDKLTSLSGAITLPVVFDST